VQSTHQENIYIKQQQNNTRDEINVNKYIPNGCVQKPCPVIRQVAYLLLLFASRLMGVRKHGKGPPATLHIGKSAPMMDKTQSGEGNKTCTSQSPKLFIIKKLHTLLLLTLPPQVVCTGAIEDIYSLINNNKNNQAVLHCTI